MLKNRLLNALGEFYKIEYKSRNIKIIKEHYKKSESNYLDLDHLLNLLANDSTSDKELRLTLDEIIYSIEIKVNRREVICEQVLLFSQIMKREIYDAEQEKDNHRTLR